jgi:DNA helicase II / ATP-dependent DNA helicase PcrA
MSQEKFIGCCTPRVRCLAGPGTGKTWAIKHRVKKLLTEGNVDGSKIFAVTFTRLAAAQLKSELNDMDVEGAETIVSSTLHSHALRILGHEQVIENLGRYPRICFDYELRPFRADLSLAFNNHLDDIKELLSKFETMWAQHQDEIPRSALLEEEIKFESEYLDWMRFHKAMTVGELVPLSLKFLNQNPINDAVTAFEHIIVDEYQDLNKADQTLIELISKDSNLAIVGDDDQSIYSFRYAEPDGIRNWLSGQEGEKEDVELNLCRRCDGKILSLANSLIRNNTTRIGKHDLVSEEGRVTAGDISFVQWHTRNNESKGIAKGIKKLLETDQLPVGEKILVLVPRRQFGQYLLEELNAIGIVDVKFHIHPDWDDKDLGKNLSLLVLHENPDDLVALRYWLGSESNNWLKGEYRKLRQYCKENDLEPKEILENPDLCRSLRIPNLRRRWEKLQCELNGIAELDDNALIDRLLPLEGPTKEISEKIRMLKQSGETGKNLTDLLTEVIVSVDQENNDTTINIMTIHGAKGLTSHTVILTSLINGLLPANFNPTSREERLKLEEERRLVYVGLTRTKHRLIISSFRKIDKTESQRLQLTLNGDNYFRSTVSSRFISEFGPEVPPAIEGDTWLISMD